MQYPSAFPAGIVANAMSLIDHLYRSFTAIHTRCDFRDRQIGRRQQFNDLARFIL
jgi:hypothetical protein